MKIGIITFNNTINYGAVLQAYALQTVLMIFGHSPEILDYTNETIKNKEINKGSHKKSIKGIYKEIIMGKKINKKVSKFKDFENRNLIFGKSLNNIREINDYYDLFITGSDQVWNMRIINRDWHFFLDFVNDKNKKISYAPSFGNDVFPDDCMEKAKKLLNDFRALSVREKSGQELIRKIINKKAEVVLDPTLLLNKSQWEERTNFTPKLKHYILVYFPHDKTVMFNFVKKLKKKTSLPVVYLSISPKLQFGVKTIYDASPDEFLGWIKNADYVVTGSFHGTAFSINMHKQFFYENSGNGSRIDNLVKLTGTDDRCIDDISSMDRLIDYDIVDKRLSDLRKDSLNWLKNNIE